MSNSDWIAIGSAIATLAGVIVAWLAIYSQLHMLRRQMTLQQFSDYTKRYQEIVQRFPEDVNTRGFQLDGREDYVQTMRAMRTYFDLCFEEWYLWQTQFLDEKTWNLWKAGMVTALSKTAFQQAWAKIKDDTEYGDSFEAFVTKELLKDQATHKAVNPSDGLRRC